MLAALHRLAVARLPSASLSPLSATAEAIANGAFPTRWAGARCQSSTSSNGEGKAADVSPPAGTIFYDASIELSRREKQVYTTLASKSRELPSVAEHGFLYGFSGEELAGANDMVKRALSTRTADADQLRRFRKQQLVNRLGRDQADSGNNAVQIAMLTETITRLSAHQMANKHDKTVGRSLQILSSRRRKLLQYMQRTDFDNYRLVLGDLQLRPVPVIPARHPPKTRAETHKQINERNRRLKNRTSRGDRGH